MSIKKYIAGSRVQGFRGSGFKVNDLSLNGLDQTINRDTTCMTAR
jgi:hypothetical protein